MTSAGCHIRQCDHGFYLSIKSTANIAIIFDLKHFSTKNFSFLTFLSQRRLPYTKNLPIAKNAARNSELMTMTMLQVYWNTRAYVFIFCKASITHHDFAYIVKQKGFF